MCSTIKPLVSERFGYIEDDTEKIEAIKKHRRLNNRQVQLSSIAGTIGAWVSSRMEMHSSDFSFPAMYFFQSEAVCIKQGRWHCFWVSYCHCAHTSGLMLLRPLTEQRLHMVGNGLFCCDTVSAGDGFIFVGLPTGKFIRSKALTFVAAHLMALLSESPVGVSIRLLELLSASTSSSCRSPTSSLSWRFLIPVRIQVSFVFHFPYDK